MLPSARPARRAIMGAIGTGALAGAMLFGAAATATADPPPPVPPPCTAAELARVMSGVTFDTSNYLTDHPDVNDFFTSLKGQPRDQIRDQVQSYLDANPQVRDELQAHPATLGRLPPTLWGSGRPPDRFGGAVCGARPFGRRRQCGWNCLCANRSRRTEMSALLGWGITLSPRLAAGGTARSRVGSLPSFAPRTEA